METTKLETPIDVMFLIHKALRCEAQHIEKMAADLDEGNSLQAFKLAFNNWAAALAYHAETEDRYMTAPLTNFPPARECEVEHAGLGGRLGDLGKAIGCDETRDLAIKVSRAMADMNQVQHEELTQRLEDVMAVLSQEIGKTRLIDRTKRHLFGRVVALRIAQDDHLDNEEAFVLPEVRQRMGQAQQDDVARHLLLDAEAQDPGWVLKWMTQYLTLGERRLLNRMATRISPTAAAVR